jgi:hypothetical protein
MDACSMPRFEMESTDSDKSGIWRGEGRQHFQAVRYGMLHIEGLRVYSL